MATMLLQIARPPGGCLCIGPPRVDVPRVFNGEPLRGTIYVRVTPWGIHAPGYVIIPLPKARHGDGAIVELEEALSHIRRDARANPVSHSWSDTAHIALEIDRNLPVWLVKRVVESCARAGFWDIDFVGIQMPR